jgi:hypothetical protein
MTYAPVVGLTGVARAGKDTVADVLRQIYGYESRSFSDMLNKALIALNPYIPEADARYAAVEKVLGYEGAKEIPEVRALLQRLGTEVGRDLLGQDIWVDALFKDIRPDLAAGKKIAIVNVRFPNEYNAVKQAGGVVWRVKRPGFEPAQGHISDRALDGYEVDAEIDNDGTVKDLANKVIDLMERTAQAVS